MADETNQFIKRLTRRADGNIGIEDINCVPVIKTVDYPVTKDDLYLGGDATAGAISFFLPPIADVQGCSFTFIKTDATANAVTLDPDGAETINGVANKILSNQYDSVTIRPTATEWMIESVGMGPVGPHNLLSATHPDTLPAIVGRGAIIVGNATPKWARVTVGGAGTFVQSDGTDTAFSTVTLPLTTSLNRILYSSAANVVGQIATAADAVLVTGGTGIPVMSTDLPGTVTIGTAYIYRVGGNDVAIADGGTGQSTAILGFNALSPVTTRGDIIVRDATNNVRLPLGAAGKILRSDGTDLVYSTSTFADTYGASVLLYSNGANTVTGLATANSGILVTSAGGVPSIGTDIPTAVTIGGAYIYRVGGTDVALLDGGTNASLVADLGGIVYSTATAFAILASTATAGKLLRSGASAAPTWSTATFPDTATTTGAYLRADGTNWIMSTLILPNASTVNRIVLSTATNTYGDSGQLTYTVSTAALTNTLSINGIVNIQTQNVNVSGAAVARFTAVNATYSMIMQMLGTGYTTAGLVVASLGLLNTSSTAGMLIASTGAATTIAFSIGGTAVTNETARVDSNGVHFFQPLMGISYKVQTNGLVGRTTLVLGTKAITITGLTTSHKAWVQLQAVGGTIAAQYRAVCTANTLTIDAITAGGIVQTLDTSTLEYICILTN